MWLRSSLPFFRLGVPTQTNETSEFITAAVASVVALRSSARCASATNSLMRASMIGVRPESIISTLARLTSTPMTLWPMEAKQAAETDPTYPNPKMLTDKPKRNSPGNRGYQGAKCILTTRYLYQFAARPQSHGQQFYFQYVKEYLKPPGVESGDGSNCHNLNPTATSRVRFTVRDGPGVRE